MNIESELQEFIAKEVIIDAPERGVTVEEPLTRSGRVDSMGLLQILGFIQQRYGVDLAAVGGPSDFESVATLAAAVQRHTRKT